MNSKDEFVAKGATVVQFEQLFDKDEFFSIAECLDDVEEKHVCDGDAGDTHSIYVRRIVTDPIYTDPQFTCAASKVFVDVVSSDRFKIGIRDAVGFRKSAELRRCQSHRMTKGSFVGRHRDADSNPAYKFAVILQIGHSFKGGEFKVHQDDGKSSSFAPEYGTVIIADCRREHEVLTVTSGERKSIVWFFSEKSN